MPFIFVGYRNNRFFTIQPIQVLIFWRLRNNTDGHTVFRACPCDWTNKGKTNARAMCQKKYPTRKLVLQALWIALMMYCSQTPILPQCALAMTKASGGDSRSSRDPDLLSPMWRESSWSWFQLTEGLRVWVKGVFLKLDRLRGYDMTTKQLFHRQPSIIVWVAQ